MVLEKFKTLLIVLPLLLMTLLFFTGSSPVPQKIYVIVDTVVRNNVNDIIGKDPDFFIDGLSKRLDRNSYTLQMIWKYSQKYNMPFSLSIAIAWQESNLINNDPNRPIRKNNDGSFDYGLYQLNSISYPNVIKNFGSIEANAKQGIAHFAEEYRRYGSFEVSTMTYNCGSVNNISNKSLERLRIILQYEEQLNEWINDIYRYKISRTLSSS